MVSDPSELGPGSLLPKSKDELVMDQQQGSTPHHHHHHQTLQEYLLSHVPQKPRSNCLLMPFQNRKAREGDTAVLAD